MRLAAGSSAFGTARQAEGAGCRRWRLASAMTDDNFEKTPKARHAPYGIIGANWIPSLRKWLR